MNSATFLILVLFLSAKAPASEKAVDIEREKKVNSEMFDVAKTVGIQFVNPPPGIEKKLLGIWEEDLCQSAVRMMTEKSNKATSICIAKSPFYEFLPGKKCKSRLQGSECHIEIGKSSIKVIDGDSAATVYVDKDSYFYVGSREDIFYKLSKK